MFKSKYSTILTILLIVVIVAIIIIAIILGINTYKDFLAEKDAKTFEISSPTIEDENIETDDKDDVEEEIVFEGIDSIGGGQNTNTEDSSTTLNLPKVGTYKGYPTVGKINIPKTGASYPILLDTSSKALDVAVAVSYPSNPQLNKPGNVVIIGHNYRNGKFFSDNDELQVGDIIKITDLDGNTLSYNIYEVFQTTPTDSAYMTRDTGENIEISLSTCTDDGNNRIVILARVEQ